MEVPGLGLPTSALLVSGGDIWSYDVATGAHEHLVSLWREEGGGKLVSAFVAGGDAWAVASDWPREGACSFLRVDQASGVFASEVAVVDAPAGVSDAVKVGDWVFLVGATE